MRRTRKRRIIAIVAMMALIITSVITNTDNSFAANSCSSISGNSKCSRTFTVKTDRGFLLGQSIKLTQTKGRITGMWTKNMYAKYYITVRYASNGKIYRRATWDGGNSYKLKLGKNTKYRITVKPYDYYRGFHTWVTPCYWTVKKTRNITLCY